ncbi:MAG: RNA polymerase sigma factor [Planctomycetes bacterium]|nr:RNA polymerase sigma factor [Planctomycetota bacterium]
MDPSTRQRIERATGGDLTAVDELLVDLLPGLQAFVSLRAGPQVLAREHSADLVQSVCREVLENLSRFQHDGSDGFRRWVYRTALRKIADRHAFLRAKKRDVGRERPLAEAESLAPEAVAATPTPSQNAAANEQAARLEVALQQLPPEHREVIVLSRHVGLSHAEIAAEMGRTESAVKSLLYRALTQLAELLDPS